MNQVSCVYGIGKYAKTKEYNLLSNAYLNPLKKQEERLTPLITSFTLKAKNPEEERNLFSIYIGKEVFLSGKTDSLLDQYHIDKRELDEYKKRGYERICILSYKKYDQEIIGLETHDRVVPDYETFKKNLLYLSHFEKNVSISSNKE